MLILCAIVIIGAASGVSSIPLKNERERNARSYEDYDNSITTTNSCNCVCGVTNRQMRVVGGNVTKPNEFPWLVGLSKNGEFYCGATLITRKHLLTAAHCVYGFDWKQITVVFGDHDRNSASRFSSIVVRGVKDVKAHEMFDYPSYNNDIAIIELDHRVDFGPGIQPACLLQSGIEDYTGKMAIVAGWGKTGEREMPSHILRKVAVPVWSKTDCYASGYGEHKLSENMFCAGYVDGQKDACQGDSGGPLHTSNEYGDIEVIGVVSWGRGCARANLPGIYTKLGNYLDWIPEQLNDECLCPRPKHTPRRA